MTTAFHGDPAIKADLLARLRDHTAAGTLVFGPTRWDGRSGTPLGVSVHGEDSAEYAERFGYPLPLAALFDTFAACATPDRAACDTLAWVEAVAPGTNLSAVPWHIAEELLILLGADRLAKVHYPLLRDLHQRDAAGPAVPREEWAALRALLEVDKESGTAEEAFASDACGAACWSLRTSRSVLVDLVDRWRRAATHLPNPDFPETDRHDADAALHALWTETQAARDAGETPHIPSLFRAREPRLAALFESNLERSNRLFRERSEMVPALVLRHLAAAGRTD